MVQGAYRDMRSLAVIAPKALQVRRGVRLGFSHEPAETVFSLDDIRPDKYNDFRLLQTFPMTLEEFSQKRDVS